jgi:hypothetical protein
MFVDAECMPALQTLNLKGTGLFQSVPEMLALCPALTTLSLTDDNYCLDWGRHDQYPETLRLQHLSLAVSDRDADAPHLDAYCDAAQEIIWASADSLQFCDVANCPPSEVFDCLSLVGAPQLRTLSWHHRALPHSLVSTIGFNEQLPRLLAMLEEAPLLTKVGVELNLTHGTERAWQRYADSGAGHHCWRIPSRRTAGRP